MGKRRSRHGLASVLACALLALFPGKFYAQQSAASNAANSEALPDAPRPGGSISGTVADVDGAEVVGARVILTTGASASRTAISDSDGSFSFAGVPSGQSTLTVMADGFAPYSQLATLHTGERLELAQIQLAVATANTDVEVSLTRQEIAQEEMHEEEKQRLLGILPNFFVTYDWNAPPLSSKQKYELAWKVTIDPTSFLISGGIAGVEQWRNDFKGYGQGAQGYGKRFGAAMADEAIGNMLGGAVLPSLLHQDPRYFYKGTGGVRSRAFYALAAAVICKGDNGRWQPNYSSVLGDFAAGGISNIYYPSADRSGAGLTIENGVLGIVGDAISNLVQEFALRRITTNTKHQGATKP